MSADLTAAIVDAANRAHHLARKGSPLAPGEYEATYSRIEVEWLTAALRAAAPLIEAQIREQVAQEIEARALRRPPIGATAADAWANATERSARIARGQS